MLFTEKLLENCRLKKAIRDGMKTKASKFDSIVLPDRIDEISGYHSTCYKCFCAVNEKKKAVPGCKLRLFSSYESCSVIILFSVRSIVDFDDQTSSDAATSTDYDESSNDTNYGASASKGNIRNSNNTKILVQCDDLNFYSVFKMKECRKIQM